MTTAPTIDQLADLFAEILPAKGIADAIDAITTRFPDLEASLVLSAFTEGCDRAVSKLTEEYPAGTGVYWGSQYWTVASVAGACALTIRRNGDPATDRRAPLRELRRATPDDDFRGMAFQGSLSR